jgi:hypothetical protein
MKHDDLIDRFADQMTQSAERAMGRLAATYKVLLVRATLMSFLLGLLAGVLLTYALIRLGGR